MLWRRETGGRAILYGLFLTEESSQAALAIAHPFPPLTIFLRRKYVRMKLMNGSRSWKRSQTNPPGDPADGAPTSGPFTPDRSRALAISFIAAVAGSEDGEGAFCNAGETATRHG